MALSTAVHENLLRRLTCSRPKAKVGQDTVIVWKNLPQIRKLTGRQDSIFEILVISGQVGKLGRIADPHIVKWDSDGTARPKIFKETLPNPASGTFSLNGGGIENIGLIAVP